MGNETEARVHGRLYVFEGAGGVGKTTLSSNFANYLLDSGLVVEHLAFPGNAKGSLGSLVRKIHFSPSSLGIESVAEASKQALHIAAHIDCIHGKILPLIRSGVSVVLDRFWWSTKVYGLVYGVDEHVLHHLIEAERLVWDEVVPYRIILIERSNPLQDEPLEIWHQLRKGYQDLAKTCKIQQTVRIVQNEGSITAGQMAVLAACE